VPAPPFTHAQGAELLALTKIPLLKFLQAMGAVEQDALTLAIVAAEDSPPTVNGRSMNELMPLAMQYGMPVMMKMQEIQAAINAQKQKDAADGLTKPDAK